MLVATGLKLLLVNLESMISKPNAGGGSKDRVTWNVKEAVHNFVHADKVIRCFISAQEQLDDVAKPVTRLNILGLRLNTNLP